MSAGFRKSLFGFNCDDVMTYVKNTHKEFSEKETLLKEKIDDLNTDIASLNTQLNEIASAKAEVEAELKKYTDKYEEIERLSENIGKLYLVSQANAKAIMDNAEDCRKTADIEIKANLSSISSAQQSLKEISENVTKTSDDFAAKVEELILSLRQAREKINADNSSSAEKSADFKAVLAAASQNK